MPYRLRDHKHGLDVHKFKEPLEIAGYATLVFAHPDSVGYWILFSTHIVFYLASICRFNQSNPTDNDINLKKITTMEKDNTINNTYILNAGQDQMINSETNQTAEGPSNVPTRLKI